MRNERLSPELRFLRQSDEEAGNFHSFRWLPSTDSSITLLRAATARPHCGRRPMAAKGEREDKSRRRSKEQAENNRALAEAIQIIDAWNSRLEANLPLFFSPTIGAALLTKHHWLRLHCSGCDIVTEVDLRVVPRDPDATITSILHSLACRRCHNKGPLPTLLGLFPSIFVSSRPRI